MTSCIAAIGRCTDIGKNCEAIVLTDHMISIGVQIPIGAFEHSIDKYRRIGATNVAMLSGEALLFDEVLKDVTEKDDFDGATLKIQQNMRAILDGRVEKTLLGNFKVNFDFLKEALKLPSHNETLKAIMNDVKSANLRTTVLLVGFKNDVAQIAEVNEFRMVNTRDINFGAIGSGGVQAMNVLMFQRHSKSDDLKTTLYNVYKAKRNSEVAVGVGKETDLFVLLPTGDLIEVTVEQISQLGKVYSAEMSFGKKHESLEEIVKGLREKNAGRE